MGISGATQPRAVWVAVRDPLPAYRRGLEHALAEAGYLVEHPLELGPWVEGGGARALVVTCASARAAQELAALRARGEDVVGVVLLTEVSQAGYREVLETGVDAVVAHDASLERILHVLGAALDRRTVLPTEVAHRLARRDDERDGVDSQQIEWLRALALGTTIEELARTVGYSERAMYRRLHELYVRLGARDRTQALLEALRRGLID